MREPVQNRGIKAFIAVIGISTISLILLEIALRIGGFYYTYSEKNDGRYVSYYNTTLPNWYWSSRPYDSIILIKPEFSHRDRANNFGFRDRDFDTTADVHSNKILVLGDSFVEGIGTRIDSAWPCLFENILHNANSQSFRVYNCGVAGSDPFFEYVMLRDKLLKLNPDKVIMSINYSDINDCISRGGMERFRSDGTTVFNKGPWFEPLYKRSHVLRFVIHFLLRYDFSLLSPSAHGMKVKEALPKIEACLSSAKELCDSKKIKFLVVLHPYIDPHDRYLKKQDQLPAMGSILEDKNIAVINLFDEFAKEVNESNYKTYSWPKDMHYTPKGYDLFAHLLYNKIKAEDPDFLMLRQP